MGSLPSLALVFLRLLPGSKRPVCSGQTAGEAGENGRENGRERTKSPDFTLGFALHLGKGERTKWH